MIDAGFDVVEEGHPSFLFARSVLITRRSAPHDRLEPGSPPQQAWLGGRWEPDPLVLDDQAMPVDIKDKALLAKTGCGHAGIVNMCRYAQRLTHDRPIYAVMGDLHLNGPMFEPLVPRVLDDLATLAPSVIVPALCTGWRAQHAIGRPLRERVLPNSVGTRFGI